MTNLVLVPGAAESALYTEYPALDIVSAEWMAEKSEKALHERRAGALASWEQAMRALAAQGCRSRTSDVVNSDDEVRRVLERKGYTVHVHTLWVLWPFWRRDLRRWTVSW